jgi:hypothetical protein
MKERRNAYMAGLMDTDGCLGIYCENSGHLKYSWHISFTNKDKSVVKWISKTFGGNFRKVEKDVGIYWTWKPQGAQHALRFLKQIYPFLTIKQREADLIFQYLSLEGQRCPEKREMLAIESKVLKQDRHSSTDKLNFSNIKPNLLQAYVSGLIDGDGSVSIRYDSYNKVTIKLANKYLPLLRALVDMYGGYIQPKADNNYEWRSCSVKNNEGLLLKLLPNLLVKREKAKIALNIVRQKLEKQSKRRE